MTSTLFVEEIKGRTTGTNANKVIVPSGQTLEVPTVTGNPSFTGGLKVNTVQNTSGTTAMTIDGSTNNIAMGTTTPTFSTGNGLHLGDDFHIGFGDGNGTRADFQMGYDATNTRFSVKCGTGSDDTDIFITTAGFVGINGTLGTSRFFVTHNASATQTAVFKSSVTNLATEIVNIISTRTNSSAFSLMKMHSNDNADVEFNFRGDGNAYADGSFNGGGADYAEYFEWKDGNTSGENRVGCSVVLDGNQIRKATSDDSASNIIGVISANAAIIGDGDSEKWKQKYLRTDFGNYDLDENGDRKLNPKWDESKKDEYVSREDRKEWDTVGLIGKLRMLKGQPTGDRWIKMRNISDTVEEWLVR